MQNDRQRAALGGIGNVPPDLRTAGAVPILSEVGQ